MQTFFCDDDYRLYLALAAKEKAKCRVAIWAYCLMPNHVHIIAVPKTNDGLARMFHSVHRNYAREINKKNNWKGHLWQERFYSCVMDEQHTLTAIRYVEQNPARAGLVNRPSDWPWSSFHDHCGSQHSKLVEVPRSVNAIGDWHAFHRCKPDSERLDEIRNHSQTGRPIGDCQFVRKIEELTGRDLQKRRVGRPRKNQ